MFYEKVDGGKVVCRLCAHYCKILPGRIGICGVRENREGTLFTLVYQKAISTSVDPVEKKPVFHLYPGSGSFSYATVGCNFHCKFCQNSNISQFSKQRTEYIPGQDITPEQIVAMAQGYECRSIAHTYTEPIIFFEYAYEIAQKAHDADIKNIFVTNGYFTEESLKAIAPYLDAANVDLKSFEDRFYRRLVGAKLQPVLDSLKMMKKLGIWVEVTTLIIPTHNDSEDNLKNIASFIHDDLGSETPWHISRFYPHYKLMDVPPTPVATLRKARQIGLKAGLRYVYSGNVPGDEGESTYCYQCGKVLIKRWGYQILDNKIKNSKCFYCGAAIDGVGMG